MADGVKYLAYTLQTEEEEFKEDRMLWQTEISAFVVERPGRKPNWLGGMGECVWRWFSKILAMCFSSSLEIIVEEKWPIFSRG